METLLAVIVPRKSWFFSLARRSVIADTFHVVEIVQIGVHNSIYSIFLKILLYVIWDLAVISSRWNEYAKAPLLAVIQHGQPFCFHISAKIFISILFFKNNKKLSNFVFVELMFGTWNFVQGWPELYWHRLVLSIKLNQIFYSICWMQ